MQAVLDEVIEKTAQFSDEERDKLIEVLQKQKNKNKKNRGNDYIHPNTICVKEHRAAYHGT